MHKPNRKVPIFPSLLQPSDLVVDFMVFLTCSTSNATGDSIENVV
jgi:hypothetical protein